MRSRFPAILVLSLSFCAAAAAQNCQNTSVGFLPINDLGTGMYQGLQGGLYPGGVNALPPAHLALGLAQAAQVVPRDASGTPAAGGRIVLLSVGMSNTSQEFTAFQTVANADPTKSPAVTLVNGAQGGQTASTIQNPNANFWTVIQQRLTSAGVTANQVQVVWLKEANASPTNGFPAYYQQLRDQLRAIAQVIKTKYPNCRLCYVSSRTYAGYATTQLNPEPYAYESGFSVKELVAAQIAGDLALNADPAAGAVVSPWLAWGPYTWADGTTPRSDGLTWLCSDFQADGTHPSPTGQTKVANMLSAHFHNHATASPWYVGTGGGTTAAVIPYGSGCPGTGGAVPNVLTNGVPWLGNPDFRIGVQQTVPGTVAVLFVSAAHAQIPLGGGCTAWIDFNAPNLLLPVPGISTTITTNAIGGGFLTFAIPNVPAAAGASVYAQWLVADPQGSLNNAATVTRGLQLRFGTSL